MTIEKNCAVKFDRATVQRHMGGDHEMFPSLACGHVSSAGGDLLLEGHLPHRRYDTQLGKSGVVRQDTGRFFRRRRSEKLAPAHRSGASCSLGDASRWSSRLAPRIYRAFQRGRPGAPHSKRENRNDAAIRYFTSYSRQLRALHPTASRVSRVRCACSARLACGLTLLRRVATRSKLRNDICAV